MRTNPEARAACMCDRLKPLSPWHPTWTAATHVAPGEAVRRVQALHTQAALYASKRVVMLVEQFAREHGKKLLVVLSFGRNNLRKRLNGEERPKHPLYVIAQDLELRLGIAQGTVAPPDYRDYLVDRIEDPNGINLASIRATIQCEGETEDKWRLVQALSAESAGSEVRPVVVATGLVAFPEDWSSRRIAITLDAKDRLGTTRSKTYPSIELSDTRRVLPGRIAHLDPRGAGSSMRLVSGNDGAVYTFGGRGDDVETELYRRAGLGSFKRGRVVGEESAKLDFGDAVIRDFYLDEDEVTRGEFLTFVRAAESGYLDPKFWPSGGRPDPARSKSWLELAADGSDDRLPITGVTWDEAAAFARWMHKRLPSLVEWEYVVRGGAGNYRPFSSWDSMRPRPAHEIVNFRSSTNGAGRAPWARGSGAEVSSEGFRNLSGNVREWTSTPREIPGEKETEPRTLMSKYKEIWLDPLRLGESLKQVGRFYVAGGAWDMTEFDFATWKVFPRGEPRPNVGFRCAVSSAEVRAGLGDRWGSAP